MKFVKTGRSRSNSDAQAGPANRQTLFSGRGADECSAHKMPFSGNNIKKIKKAHHPSAKHRRPHSKQDDGSITSCRRAGGLVVLLQKTDCTTAERLIIANFELIGSSLCRKHGLATFVHERLNWILFSQSPLHRTLNGSAWMLMDTKSSTSTSPTNTTANI